MIDFHTHILPGIDDGARTPEASFRMLRELKILGFSDVVLTPHFYPDKSSAENFLENRRLAVKKLAEHTGDRTGLPNVYIGCEMHLSEHIFNNTDISKLCIGGGRFLLTELPDTDFFSEVALNAVSKLINDYNVVPVLAHIDRYAFLLKEKNLYRFLEAGCLAQVNFSAFSKFGIKGKILKYIEKGYISALGSDSHYAPVKSDMILKSISLIEKKAGRDKLERFFAKSAKILGISGSYGK